MATIYRLTPKEIEAQKTRARLSDASVSFHADVSRVFLDGFVKLRRYLAAKKSDGSCPFKKKIQNKYRSDRLAVHQRNNPEHIRQSLIG